MNKEDEKTTGQHPPFITEPEWVPVAKRVRCYFNNECIADSDHVMLKRQFPMVYFFPHDDVKAGYFEKSKLEDKTDDWGTSSSRHVVVEGKTAEDAAWIYEQPNDKAPENLNSYVALKWEKMDRWLEEDEEVRIHPRDPYHRIDVCHSSRHVRVEVNGETVAETHSPLLLFETGLPVRFYIRKTDIHMKLLHPTEHHTGCPYKGEASYYSVVTKGNEMKNVAWTYPYPNEEALKVKDHVAFFTEKLDNVFVDGKRLPKAKTKWSD